VPGHGTLAHAAGVRRVRGNYPAIGQFDLGEEALVTAYAAAFD